MSLWKNMARAYQNHMSRVLRGYGLRLEDIFNESHPEYYKAVQRLTEEQRMERTNRIRRALDISFKRTELPAQFTAGESPYQQDLMPLVEEAEAEAAERAALTGKSASRFGLE